MRKKQTNQENNYLNALITVGYLASEGNVKRSYLPQFRFGLSSLLHAPFPDNRHAKDVTLTSCRTLGARQVHTEKTHTFFRL